MFGSMVEIHWRVGRLPKKTDSGKKKEKGHQKFVVWEMSQLINAFHKYEKSDMVAFSEKGC